MGLFDPKKPLVGKVVSARRSRAVTASAARVTEQKAGGLRRLSQPWQQRSLSYYDLVGEAWFASQFYARSLKQIRFFPALKTDEGELEEIESGPVLDLWNRIQGPGGGTVEIQEQYGRLMFLTGEGYLLAQGIDDREVWEFVSNDELRMDSTGKLRRYTSPSAQPTELKDLPDDDFGELEDDEAVAYRLWRRHPRYSNLADSPMHAVLDLFEELMLLQMVVRARVKSRLAAAGLLILDDSITFPNPDVEADDSDPKNDVFLREMTAHLTAAIADEGSAAAVVPHLIRIPNPEGRALDTLIKHIRIHDPNETYRETGLRKECIERISIGLDMPPEILLGIGDSNHWTAWAIDEQTAKAHIFPVADGFGNDVASAYLRPASRDAGFAQWEQVAIGYDPAELVVHPDRGENAKEAFDRRAIGYTTFRESLGFNDEDAATDEDIELMDSIDGRTNDSAPVTDNSTDEDRPDQPDEDEAAALLAPSPRYERIMGAAEFGVHRARELAGSRLRSRMKGEAKTNAESVPNDRLAHALGYGAMPMDPADLVTGAAQSFSAAATRWGIGGAALASLGAQIEAHAAATLFEQDPPPLPAGFTALLARVERETR